MTTDVGKKMWLSNNILRDILYKNNTVCCLCLKPAGEDALRVYDEIYFEDPDATFELATILRSIFESKITNIEYLSHAICEVCAKSAISAYKFIDKCTEMNEMMTNFLSNLTKSLEEFTYKNLTKGIYIAADPKTFQSKIYCDWKKSVRSVKISLKRFQTLRQPKQTICDLCGVVLRNDSLGRHRQRCKTRKSNKQRNTIHNIDNEIEQSNEINDYDSKSEKIEINNVGQSNEINFDDSEKSNAQKKQVNLFFLNLERVSCEYCGISVRNKYGIKKHMIYHCQVINDSEREIIKNDLDAKKANREAMKKKMKMINAESGITKAYNQCLERELCEYCGTSCSNKYNLKKHLLIHCKVFNKTKVTGKNAATYLKMRPYVRCVKPMCFTCFYCDKSFPSKSTLRAHIHKKCENTPSEIRYSVCSHCGKKCRKSSLKEHEKSHTLHFDCSKCGKVIKTQRSYKLHLSIPNCLEKPLKYPQSDKKYNCQVCGKLFASRRTLQKHIPQHTDTGFTCMLCNKMLSTKSSLKLHMVVHTKEKKFECEICGGHFVSKHSLLYHTRTHTGEKPYKCQHCDSWFLSASRLNIHTRIKHLPPLLECKYCLRKFSHWGGLNRHRRRHFDPSSSLYMKSLDPQMKSTTKSNITDSEVECLSS